jgi:TolB-like protein
MRKCSIVALIIFLMTASTGSLWAKDKSVVAVFPFSVHSAESIDYVQQGIWDMLTSRISTSDKIEAISKDTILVNLQETGKKELSLPDVYGLGKKMNADFAVWGSITKIGNNVSIDGKLIDISTYMSPVGIFTQSQGLDEIIPKINDFAQRISNHILGGAPSAQSFSTTPLPTPEQSSPQLTREKEIIAGMKAGKKGTFTSIPINPDYINSPQTLDKKGFWMSQQFGTEFKGMDIGDVNSDGLNEIVIIDYYNVMIYQRKGDNLTLVQQIPGKKTDKYISVDVADINSNGINEIIVTNLVRDQLTSFVLEWRGGKFLQIASNLPWLLRVIHDSSGMPILLGQQIGSDIPFDSPIYELVWDDNQYRSGKKMKIPVGLSLFGIALDTLEQHNTEKVIAFNDDNYLVIYEKTDKPLSKIEVLGGSNEKIWKSGDQFGGSNNSFEPYMKVAFDMDSNQIRAYASIRLLAYDTNKDGKKELIVVKNISSTGGYFKKSQLFSASEIYDLEWDGMGLAENWRTKKIPGYVADYQIKDIDNDGQNEIVLAVVLSVGVTLQEKSAIVAYKLNLPEGSSPKQ